MIIKRIVSGTEMEFELTTDELYLAYDEQQHRFDVSDVKAWFDAFDDDDLMESYGQTREEIEEEYDDIAREMRRNIDKYDMDWISAREAAIAEFV